MPQWVYYMFAACFAAFLLGWILGWAEEQWLESEFHDWLVRFVRRNPHLFKVSKLGIGRKVDSSKQERQE